MSVWIPNTCSAIAGNRPIWNPNVHISAKVYLDRGASQKWWCGNRKSNTTMQPSSGPSLWFSLGRFASGCSLCNLQLSESNELNDCKSLAWVLLGLAAPAAHRRAGGWVRDFVKAAAHAGMTTVCIKGCTSCRPGTVRKMCGEGERRDGHTEQAALIFGLLQSFCISLCPASWGLD